MSHCGLSTWIKVLIEWLTEGTCHYQVKVIRHKITTLESLISPKNKKSKWPLLREIFNSMFVGVTSNSKGILSTAKSVFILRLYCNRSISKWLFTTDEHSFVISGLKFCWSVPCVQRNFTLTSYYKNDCICLYNRGDRQQCGWKCDEEENI